MSSMNSEPDLTPEQFADIGKMLREAEDGNFIVGSFAAEQAGQSYPFSKAMCKVIFDMCPDDEALGRKFVDWDTTKGLTK